MDESTPGLRDAKKQRTRDQLAEVALRLFLERGFDAVSVAEVAAAADVSKPTLFRYYPSKEDLVLDRFADHQDEAARIVRERAAGEGPVQALHRHFRAALAAFDPITGLNDHPSVIDVQHLLYGTPSLQSRLTHYTEREITLLAEALTADPLATDPLTARLAATHMIATRHELGRANWHRISTGRSAADSLPQALADADRAFALLSSGLDAALREE
ncbi:TetR/AcrR family transcriptional regulator [Kitasatospora viridis]|uniref:TetR family transcriptional regulator n=1 Tax=Kitasatospora viridis TaxID=281105 RepID=A0A561S9C8_9ACTN|nr:TetR family transcriptional regulator [Kitasatospora viridis]TWF71470.1 TetR family transcriptional regulator [Kitasatospora viridis]